MLVGNRKSTIENVKFEPAALSNSKIRACNDLPSMAGLFYGTLTVRLPSPKCHLTTMDFLRKMWRFLMAVQLLPALESGEETLVGGQAVLEGVMMRSPHAWAIAVRTPSGTVSTHSEPIERPSEQH